jgi:isocitrate dehydrogenase
MAEKKITMGSDGKLSVTHQSCYRPFIEGDGIGPEYRESGGQKFVIRRLEKHYMELSKKIELERNTCRRKRKSI